MSRHFRRNLEVSLFRLKECFLGRFALSGRDRFSPGAPKLIDALGTPQGALLRGTDGLAGDAEDHWVGVHLREVPQGHPTRTLDGYFEVEVVNFVVRGHFFAGDAVAVDDQFDLAQAALSASF